MPDSNITKKALAMAMKELMEQIPFSKISVSDICEKCGMNRKSFYYHFKDKYDLVNWIFDVEFFQAVHVRDYNLPNWSWRFLEDSCQYFYENQSFYRKALQIEGQNSFVEHFRETLKPLLKMVVKNILADPQYEEFCINFYSDAFIAALERWLLFHTFSLLGITVSRTCHVSCRRKSMRNLSFRSEKVITEMLLK